MNIKSVAHVMRRFGLTRRYVNWMIGHYGIGTFKIGKITMIDMDALEAAVNAEKALIGVSQVCEETGLSCRQVVRLVECGILPGIPYGSTYKFESMDAVMNALRERLCVNEDTGSTGPSEGPASGQ